MAISLIACSSYTGNVGRGYRVCLNCEQTRRILTVYRGPYYGCDFHCLACGKVEQDGFIFDGADPAWVLQRWIEAAEMSDFWAAVEAYEVDYFGLT